MRCELKAMAPWHQPTQQQVDLDPHSESTKRRRVVVSRRSSTRYCCCPATFIVKHRLLPPVFALGITRKFTFSALLDNDDLVNLTLS